MFSSTLAFGTANGDFDADGDVDARDLARWKTHFGGSRPLVELMPGDADMDNDSDGADFLVWQRNVGSLSPASIPEPAAGLLALGLAAALFASPRVGPCRAFSSQ